MDKETFLARWSRLKRAAEPPAAPAAPASAAAVAPAAPVELPPLESLDFAADFSGFLQPRVEEALKRAALKKLFHSEHFNQMDGLDVYIEDYNRFEPIPPDMLARLEHAKETLFGPREREVPPASDGGAGAPQAEAADRADPVDPADPADALEPPPAGEAAVSPDAPRPPAEGG